MSWLIDSVGWVAELELSSLEPPQPATARATTIASDAVNFISNGLLLVDLMRVFSMGFSATWRFYEVPGGRGGPDQRTTSVSSSPVPNSFLVKREQTKVTVCRKNQFLTICVKPAAFPAVRMLLISL